MAVFSRGGVYWRHLLEGMSFFLCGTMFLKRIEMVGFKSFARKTVLEFSGADESFPITAVVGPNGSGKSNVADAIRWAIGEQSAKHLRGKKSEDVIFAGTDKKSRLGSASVSLFFENKDKRIPIEYEEVVITRRLFRNGESEYRINDARVRLLDITDLLARASIGRDSSSVITQGMSDAVLLTSPLERRIFLEEAAGVKQYRIEKERAIKKLQTTTENVAQVEALLREIEPHLKNLRKQAEKSSRRKDVADTLHKKQLLRFSFLYGKLIADRASFSAESLESEATLKNLEVEIETIHAQLHLESERANNETKRREGERDERACREHVNRVEREYAVLLGKIDIEDERRKPREVRESIAVDRSFVRGRIEEIRAHQEKLVDRISHVESLDELQELRELARVVSTRLSELYDEAGSESLVTTHIVSLPPEELEKSDRRLAELQAESKKLLEERDRLRVELLKKERAIEEERRASEEGRKRFFALERSAREMNAERNRAKDRLNEGKIRLARIDVREEDLTNELFEELQLKPDALPVWDASHEAIDPDRYEREIIRLKVELEHIGGIDPLVVEECAETEKRFLFLTSESEDLKRAIVSLRHIVREMEVKIHDAFESAWKEVNLEFDRYFRIIFGGGSASLKKVSVERRSALFSGETIEERGILQASGGLENETHIERDAGVDIVVSPPGKRIANLSMLSGGERSLVALALLFALIAHNPPPFAVLDEVEAALDEANSKRFGDLLSELSRKTQFVAITHNRETMRRAAILYGVTMGDDGVSKVLSLRLDQVGTEGKLLK